jgi:hypothetical protein
MVLFLFGKQVAEMDVVSIGKSIGQAGGDVWGAIGVLMVSLGIGIAWVLWKAYQEKITEDKSEDKKRIGKLETEVIQLRQEGNERENKLINLVADGQRIQNQTNMLLADVNVEQKDIKTRLAYLQGSVDNLNRKK